jgi:hypothetical protein
MSPRRGASCRRRSRSWWILVHLHAGGGFENAAVIEALLHSADGAWGGLPKRAAIIGHASLGELIANLVRAGNPNMHRYRLEQLLPLATSLQIIDERAPVPDDRTTGERFSRRDSATNGSPDAERPSRRHPDCLR